MFHFTNYSFIILVSIGLVWDSDHPSVETTTEVAKNIGTTILMQDVSGKFNISICLD